MAALALLDDPLEIGRRIGAACGYTAKKQKEIAAELERDERTLRSYIRGNLGDYNTPELRRSLIERIEKITGCPPEIFGLSEPEPGEVDQLRRELLQTRTDLADGLAKLGVALDEQRTSQEEIQRRLKTLERTGGGPGN